MNARQERTTAVIKQHVSTLLEDLLAAVIVDSLGMVPIVVITMNVIEIHVIQMLIASTWWDLVNVYVD